ncbi:MAG: hypothetical protein JWO80_4604 [Bryobacterales bacterium]|nr:hypothetical protein [Bryobacterales bacterium]
MVSALASPATADTIDLSSRGSFIFSHGQEMIVRFSVWNYGFNNPGASPYPTSIGLELVGITPLDQPVSTMPGSSSQYFPGYVLQGTLESLDGTASAPLLGLGGGPLVVTPSTLYGSGGSSSVAAIDANAALTLNLSQQIFGPDITSPQSSALIVLQNLGSDLVIGMGGGMSLRNAITEPSVTGLGNVQTSGITHGVTLLNVPEPRTTLTLVLALSCGVLLARRRDTRR